MTAGGDVLGSESGEPMRVLGDMVINGGGFGDGPMGLVRGVRDGLDIVEATRMSWILLIWRTNWSI